VTTLVLGIDEAGRGPLLGEMVLAAVALEPSASRRLSRLGVADSKGFGSGADAHAARCALAVAIRAHASYTRLEVCDVATIDAYVARGALNVLERERAALLIAAAPACKRIVADGKRLFGALRETYPHLHAVDGGESAHVAVAAASILAKVHRDELFARIAARYEAEFGPLRGGGYVNEATRQFVRAHFWRYRRLPDEIRTSWPWPDASALAALVGAAEASPDVRQELPC
jgi:ribonuclease HII